MVRPGRSDQVTAPTKAYLTDICHSKNSAGLADLAQQSESVQGSVATEADQHSRRPDHHKIHQTE